MRDTPRPDFDLDAFMPYLLNQAAEHVSLGFAATYKAEYGLTRTQWRVMANLGRFGAMSAAEICRISHIEKTRASRAVAQLEAEGYLTRARASDDRRREDLALTEAGRDVYIRLGARGMAYQADMAAKIGPERFAALEDGLRALIAAYGDATDD
ncbi:MarR family winged helix-turn-helix transcriptional regulator [Roseibaca sp. V10]|uniref:MarR family winged helix-turn-helix transcriptional regulator n=1 Tax=Roseinatronobacter domitianus TaxID=2940293 RepID=A0ABT0LZ18_9RHOB|nr:MarR family transcriptional regulator [Roseibaca domitiana]MCL1627861.1 MarR family winged helix-turn-helix transcriptional regulator [Roseibaca domitiana]